MGPLHGLPISLKDQFCIKGLETIMGYAGWIGRVADRDSVLVEILYECGAVPFVRTNVPQTLMWPETYNHVFGRTTNPYNRSMTCGGSSGGEGALVALRGSPLGVGTDIGGSVRIPSAFCGLYGLRPSYNRLPYYGAVNSMEGQESISSVLGPMTNSLAGVRAFTKAVIDAKPWRKDPVCLRKEWNEREYALGEHGGRGGKMCFAVMWDNGVVKPHPPVKRAMELTKAALEAAGHTVIDWENHRLLEIYTVGVRIFAADNALDMLKDCELSGEPLLKTMSPATDAHEFALDEPMQVAIVGEPKHLSAYELWELHKEKRALRKSHLDHWEATVSKTGTGRPVDAIISPVAAYASCPHGCNSNYLYTGFCNFLDYTAHVFPATFADKALDGRAPPHEFYNREDEAVYKLCEPLSRVDCSEVMGMLTGCFRYVDDPELWHGMPVGLQLIGRTHEEEGVIGMTEVVDEALKKYKQSRGLR
ncbi:hypothetical protein BN946_scf184920.g26 [Trametes cinnabarina]|uniref:amidase n=1 Tax=Pycnoporus cinnabarinus TaxID=5643 RepID=A0A060SB83_PYCCI|nr:hypothetical protein BN946_scf184920.g26 [Trametes cinnabarina]